MTDTDHIATLPGIHVVAKPVGPACNLNCDYCFYLEKYALFAPGEKMRMSDDVLRAFIRNYVESQPTPAVEFVWQGGEPTILGVDFFRKVVEFQKPFRTRKTITNSLQTNGTLLNDEWCKFLKNNNFMVGISLDGPREIHDLYRKDRGGNGTFEDVMRGLQLLQEHGVEYNVLACVGRETARYPLEVYQFLKEAGVAFIQFTPVVERVADPSAAQYGLRLACSAALNHKYEDVAVTPWSVLPVEYGDFLIAIYEEWVRHDVGRVFVMNFEWALNAWLGNPSPVCIHAGQCGRSIVIEHNGDVYACDHCVYPQYKLGNILNGQLSDMVESSLRAGFGVNKTSSLPRCCRRCEVRGACNGGCPKHRFAISYDGEPGLHYLCAGYNKFFRHIRKYLHAMTQLLEHNQPIEYIMQAADGPLAIVLKDQRL